MLRRIRDLWVLHPRADLVLLTLVAVASVTLWFRDAALLIGADLTIPFYPGERLGRYLFAYNPWIGTGSQNPTLYGAPDFVETLGFYVLQSFAQVQLAQLTFLILVYAVGALATYSLTRSLIRGERYARVSGFCAAVFFLFNPFLFADNYSQIVATSVPRAAFPLFLTLLIRGLETGRLRYAAALGLTSFLVAITFPVEQYAIFAAVMGTLVLLAFLLPQPRFSVLRERLAARRKFIVAVIVLIVLSNLYLVWYLASLFGLLARPYQGFSPNLQVGTSLAMHNAIRLFGAWPFYSDYGGTPYVPYAVAYLQNPVLMALGFVIPILAFGATLLRPKQRSIRFMAVAALATVFLAKNYNPPFGEVFDLLVRYVPGFKLFYGGWPFIDVLALEYATLIGVTVGALAEKLALPRGTNRHALRRPDQTVGPADRFAAVSIALLLVLLVCISWPLATGDVSVNWVRPHDRGISVPPEYGTLNTWLQERDPTGRVFVLPTLDTYFATTWGYQGTSAFYQTILQNPVVQPMGGEYNIGRDESGSLIDSAYSAADRLTLLPPAVSVWNAGVAVPQWQRNNLSSAAGDTLAKDSAGGSPVLTWTIHDTVAGWDHQLLLPWTGSLAAFRVLVMNLTQPALPADLEAALGFGVWDSNQSLGVYTFSVTNTGTVGPNVTTMFKLGVPDVGAFDPAHIVGFSLDYTGAGDGSTWNVSLGALEASQAAPDALQLASLLYLLGVSHVLLDFSSQTPFYPGTDIETPLEALSQPALFQPELDEGFLRLYRVTDTVPLFGPASTTVFYNATSEIGQLAPTLAAGRGTVAANVSGLSESDLMSLSSAGPGPQTWTPHTLGPSVFQADFNASSPFVLVLNVGYSDVWLVEIDGIPVNLPHFAVDGFANGWVVMETGSHSLTVVYGRQLGYSVALAATLITLGVEVATLALLWATERLRLHFPGRATR